MNGQSIGWDESIPADTENAGLGDDRMRSIKTSARVALDDEHVWPSGGGVSGAHRYGSARPYFGTQSRVSSDGTDGRLMLTSDTSRLFGLTSAGTVFLGGQNVISAFTQPSTLPQRHIWVEEFGVGTTTASGNSRIAYSSAFSGIPYLTITPNSNVSIANMVAVHESRTTDFTVLSWADASGTSITLMVLAPVPFVWRSLGSRAI